MKYRIVSPLLTLIVVFLTVQAAPHLARAGDDSETKLTLAQLPPAVSNTLTQLAAGGEIDDITLESEDGQKIYEAEIEGPGNRELEVEIAEDGTLLSEEEEIPVATAPEPVRKAIESAAAGATLGDVLRIKERGQTFYEAEIRRADQTSELEFNEDGSPRPHSESDSD